MSVAWLSYIKLLQLKLAHRVHAVAIHVLKHMIHISRSTRSSGHSPCVKSDRKSDLGEDCHPYRWLQIGSEWRFSTLAGTEKKLRCQRKVLNCTLLGSSKGRLGKRYKTYKWEEGLDFNIWHIWLSGRFNCIFLRNIVYFIFCEFWLYLEIEWNSAFPHTDCRRL